MRYFISPESSNFLRVMRTCKDFEIDMELSNGRRYVYNGSEEYKLLKGDILVRKPGSTCRSLGKQTSYLLTIDFAKHVTDSNYNRNLPGEIHPEFKSELLDNLTPIIHPQNTEEIKSIYKHLLMLSDYDSPIAKELVKELIFLINAEICKKNYEILKPQQNSCDIVISYMRKNLSENITLEELAEVAHLEKSYLIRRFRKYTGKTPIEMLIDFRMEKATDLITNTNMKINDVSALCGYNTPSFFISEYKKRYGITPESLRNSLK